MLTSDKNYVTEPGIAGRFVDCSKDDKGCLDGIYFHGDENFNFAFDVVDELGRKCPDKLAMLHISKDKKERRFTFKEMSRFSAMTANYFEYLGIKKGDRVMLVLKRHYQFWFAILALHKIGAVAIPATNLLVKKDFEYRFKAGKIDAVVCTADGEVSKEIDRAARSYDGLKTKIMVGGKKKGWHSYNRELKYFSSHYKRPTGKNAAGGDDPMIMFFTSGTTSYPKITTHNYKYPLGHYITARYWHQVDPDGIHFAISDTGWGKALWGKIYGQWLCEAAIFTYDFDNFDAKEILKMIEKYKLTTFCAPPTVYRVLVHMRLERYDLTSVQNWTTAGEALNPEIYRKFMEATGKKIMEGFGQTETTLTIGNLAGTEPRAGSMGLPSPAYDIHVMRPDGSFAEPNEVGEIVVGTKDTIPNGLFVEYFGDEEKTSQVWHDDYYHTGDTAYQDEDGYLWYVGRVDDIIKSSGYRVGPFEIENEIMKLPYVMECAVTSVPDPIRGQAIKATIVLTNEQDGSESLKHDIVKYLKDNIASYKWPKFVDFAKELPKTISGKVRRVEIKENDWEQAKKDEEEKEALKAEKESNKEE